MTGRVLPHYGGLEPLSLLGQWRAEFEIAQTVVYAVRCTCRGANGSGTRPTTPSTSQCAVAWGPLPAAADLGPPRFELIECRGQSEARRFGRAERNPPPATALILRHTG